MRLPRVVLANPCHPRRGLGHGDRKGNPGDGCVPPRGVAKPTASASTTTRRKCDHHGTGDHVRITGGGTRTRHTPTSRTERPRRNIVRGTGAGPRRVHHHRGGTLWCRRVPPTPPPPTRPPPKACRTRWTRGDGRTPARRRSAPRRRLAVYKDPTGTTSGSGVSNKGHAEPTAADDNRARSRHGTSGRALSGGQRLRANACTLGTPPLGTAGKGTESWARRGGTMGMCRPWRTPRGRWAV